MHPQVSAYCADQSKISNHQTQAVLNLLINEKCTIPFIARYRKEATGNLNETQLRLIEKLSQEFEEREKRREFILETLNKMEVLTPDLKKSVERAETIAELEDLYAPYKSKRKTKATTARENGLEPLADEILNGVKTLDEHKNAFTPTDKVASFEDALSGAKDIIIEKISHHIELKDALRDLYKKESILKSEKKKDAEKIPEQLKYKDYFEFSEPTKNLFSPKSSHRFLALTRGEKQKVLKVNIEIDNAKALQIVENFIYPNSKKLGCKTIVEQCAETAYSKNIHYSLCGELLYNLGKNAEEAAISVFGINLKSLLLAPYLGSKTILGIDPGIRTGCKVVVVDPTGKLMLDHVIYLQGSDEQKTKASTEIEQLIEALKVEYIAIGDGTFGRETLAFIEENISKVKDGTIKATLISESGASVYSASEAAIEEFPDKDVTVRGAISIARRFQDPLSELVKIDPKSIGVGQYQHDLNETRLKKGLEGIVEDCVNYVGVDLNTASTHILSFISGVGPALSKNIIAQRNKKGRFVNRKELLEVPRFSEKIFEQAAGFLRIYDGKHPLDRTFVHPENYDKIENWCADHSHTLLELITKKEVADQFEADTELKKQFGEHTFEDIIKSLKAPSQDPRVVFKSTEFNKNLKSIDDLVVGSWYTGVVNNITNFGAFVNIGIKESGLVHISQLADRFVDDPLKVIKVGEEVKVRVVEVDKERKRVALSCKKEGETHTPKVREPRAPKKPKQQFKSDPNRIKTPLQTSKEAKKHKPQRTAHPKPLQTQKQAPLNNAFAALKDLKIK